MINHAPYGYGLLGAYRNDELMSPANNHAPMEKNQSPAASKTSSATLCSSRIAT